MDVLDRLLCKTIPFRCALILFLQCQRPLLACGDLPTLFSLVDRCVCVFISIKVCVFVCVYHNYGTGRVPKAWELAVQDMDSGAWGMGMNMYRICS